MKRGRDEGRVHYDRGVPQTRFAFKALCTDDFVGALLKEKARMKEQVQQDCGVRLVFSNKGDYFPGSKFRVLGIYSDDVDSIIQGFDRVLTMHVDQAEEERGSPGASELLGKEPGEYVFRLVLTRQMGGLLIGHAGANIKSLREETGGKIFIENDSQLAHRLVRIIGTREVIYDCLGKINELIMGQNETDDFQRYVGLVNFAEASANGWVDQGDGPTASRQPRREERRDEKRRSPARKRGRRERGRREERGGSRRGRGRDGQGDDSFAGGGHDQHEEEGAAGETVDMVSEVVDSFPPGMGDLRYMVFCKIPAKMVRDVEGRNGEVLRTEMAESATEIGLDRDGTLTIQGEILNVYQAHASMMKRVYEAEAAATAATAAPAVHQIQNQIQELQRQLNAFKQQQQ